jgi:hypothetical protein
MPAYGFDASIHRAIEEQCRDALGRDRFDALTAQGGAMTHDELVDLVEAAGP